jgi:hypothetical protein
MPNDMQTAACPALILRQLTLTRPAAKQLLLLLLLDLLLQVSVS